MMSETAPGAPDPHAVAHWRRRQQAAPWLHAEVGRRMAERLEWIKRSPQAWCDWGTVTDGAAAIVAQHYPRAERIAVEPGAPASSPDGTRRPWLARWLSRRDAPPRAPDDVPAAAADLLWSNMNLHFAPDPAAQMRAWHRVLRQEGFVMFSCFGPDTLRELRAVYREAGWGPVTVNFADMHDLGDQLVASGFADPVMDMEHLTLSWPTPQALLAELRTLGGNASAQRFAGLRTPRWRERLETALASRQEGCSLTFEIVYGHAFKVGSGVPLAAESAIGLDDMRALLRGR